VKSIARAGPSDWLQRHRGVRRAARRLLARAG
jgi:hypothetical protein